MFQAFKVGFLILLLATLSQSRPFEDVSENEDISEIATDSPLKIISYKVEEVPKLYLVLFGDIMTETDTFEKEKAIFFPRYEHKREKRSGDDDDDLETAAGTNVLRPLFVYRQQLAYRERLKKSNRRNIRF